MTGLNQKGVGLEGFEPPKNERSGTACLRPDLAIVPSDILMSYDYL